jgi:uncharacterized membrane protein YfcA
MSSSYLLPGIILFAGSFLQSAVGFGFALFCTPLLLWCGFSLPSAIAVGGGAVLIQLSASLWKVHDAVRWKEVIHATVYRYLTTPLGVVVLVWVANLPVSTVKSGIGVFVIVVLVVQRVCKVEPQERLHPLWGVVAFSVSGFLGGLIGMGGPPVVLWLAAHNWSSREMRAFAFATFFLTIPLSFALLYYYFGFQILKDIGFGIAAAPLVVLGSLLGVRMGNRLSGERLRFLMVVLLVIISVISISAPFL